MTRVWVDRECARCGASFRVPAYRLATGRGVYCSKRCHSSAVSSRAHRVNPRVGDRNGNWKGGRSANPGRYYADRYLAKYPERAAAYRVLASAVRAGRVTKPSACEECGVVPNRPLDGHHDDHSLPLVVRWLCRPCHRKADEKLDLQDIARIVKRTPAAVLQAIRRGRMWPPPIPNLKPHRWHPETVDKFLKGQL
jgi:hypothetical protein